MSFSAEAFNPFEVSEAELDRFLAFDSSPNPPSLDLTPHSISPRRSFSSISPVSTESAQSMALDPVYNFDFEAIDFGAGLGLMGMEQAPQPMDNVAFPPTFDVTVNPFALFGGQVDAALYDATVFAPALLAGPSAVTASALPSPLATPLSATGTKRKAFESASDKPAKRGRPKATDGSSRVVHKVLPSGKPSTARPRSVIPEKGWKDGSATRATGLTREEANGLASFDDLVLLVKPQYHETAVAYGEKLEAERLAGAEIAKKARDQKMAKTTELQGQVKELEDKVSGMKAVLQGLVDRGVVSLESVAEHLA